MDKNHLIYLGLSGFPYGLAPIQKQKLISRSLIKCNWDVSIIAPKSVHKNGIILKQEGYVEGVYYKYIFDPFRPKNFIIRNFQKFITPIKEFYILWQLNRRNKISAAIVSNRNLFFTNIWYFVVSRILKFRLVINLVEDYTNRESRPLHRRINDYLFSKYGLFFSDGYLPISHYLINKYSIKHRNFFYLPIMTDMTPFEKTTKFENDKPFFLYVGAAAYFDAIKLILLSFSKAEISTHELVLVVNGSKNELNSIKLYSEELNISTNVKIISNLDYEILVKYMNSATAVLLPLFNTIQDNARFPHKLGEYFASKTPVITCMVGELNFFINENENAIIFRTGDAIDFAAKMKWVITNLEKAKEIGFNGYFTAKQNFEFSVVGNKLNEFLLKLIK